MFMKRFGIIGLALGLGLGVAGCTDGYGYGGAGVGYASDPYYGGGYGDGYYGAGYGGGYDGFAGYGGLNSYYGWSGERLLTAGIEAGGNLAAVAALMARDRGGPALDGQILIMPMLDPGLTSDSMRALKRNPDIAGVADACAAVAIPISAACNA